MDKRQCLLMKYSAQRFALWELHLYLDTHPCDTEALKMYHSHEAEAERLGREYEEAYGPLTSSEGEGTDWLKDPWPWERSAN